MAILDEFANKQGIDKNFLRVCDECGRIFDILDELLKLLICVALLLEFLDVATIWQDSQELKHGLILIVEELSQIRGRRILIYIHNGEYEVITSKFLGKSIEVGFGPVAFWTILFCEK
jgi:hypothetical protein